MNKVISTSSNLIIRPEKSEVKSGLIILPNTPPKKYMWGTVEALGDSKDFEIEVGSNVLYKTDGVTKLFEGESDEVHVVPYRVLLFWR